MDSRIDRNRIGDLLEIQRLKGLYFYYLDHKEWPQWRSLFTDDARLIVDSLAEDGNVTTAVYEPGDPMVQYVSTALATANSVHHGHTPLIELESDTEARGIWAMADIVDRGSEGVMHGYGHYRERYRKEDGVWKFTEVHLTRLRVEVLPARSAAIRQL